MQICVFEIDFRVRCFSMFRWSKWQYSEKGGEGGANSTANAW